MLLIVPGSFPEKAESMKYSVEGSSALLCLNKQGWGSAQNKVWQWKNIIMFYADLNSRGQSCGSSILKTVIMFESSLYFILRTESHMV